MRKAGNPIAIAFFALVLVLLSPIRISADETAAWKEEFERICAQTEIATSLSAEQLHQLIKDSDALLEELHGVEDPWAKVYIFRLKNCQNFFNFALEWQEKERQDLNP